MADRDEAIDLLSDLLERERQAILAARFDILERLAAEKERALIEITKVPLPRERFAALRQSCARNQALLAAARSGILRARERLGDILRAREMRTYDSKGRLAPPVPNAGARTIRRA